ncbi:MAG: NUDIX domain-containing protein [Chloroflexi bacterium]|nr:NUDIX domain-containing protein [Chloroflexota bacterium]
MSISAPLTPAYGADANRYQLIPRVLVIVTHEGRVLLLRRAAHKKLWPGKVNAPGGHVERGEDPYAAALRELNEETGAKVGPLTLRGLLVAETGLPGSGILVFVYQAEAVDPSLQSGPEGEPFWADRSALSDLDLLPDLPQLLELTLDQPDFFYLYKTPTSEGEDIRIRVVSHFVS